jgi:asparagine synthase (glutamine-hydrolysing)
MCGIFGSFGISLSPTTIYSAFKIIRHRGPDDEHFISNYLSDTQYTCGAVRLAFQDIPGGRQPLWAGESKSLLVSMNGEIYNYNSLLHSLPQDKFDSLTTSCDTEIIAPLFELCGIECIGQLRGMFAISIWDQENKTGHLAVDFLAQKPLFYVAHGTSLFYASDLKTLVSIIRSTIPTEELDDILCLNQYSMLDVLKYKCILGGETPYNGIKKLLPGAHLSFRPQKSPSLSLSRLPYSQSSQIYALNYVPTDIPDTKNICDELDFLLRTAIKRRVDPSVPQALYLSGGLDSSLIAVMLRDIFPKTTIHTFTLEYDNIDIEGKSTDADMARIVASQINSHHHSVRVDPTMLGNDLNNIVSAFGEPFASVPSMWYVAREISSICKYSISGDGADELFGSYYTHRQASELLHCSGAYEPSAMLSNYMSSFLPPATITTAFSLRQSQLEKYYYSNRSFLCKSNDPLNLQLLFEAEFLFPHNVLTYVDRLSMIHSVEPRSPFLDRDLWSYASQLPGNIKIKDGVVKWLLKELAQKYLPNSLIYRKKEGFVFPLYPYLINDRARVLSNIQYLLDSPLSGYLNISSEVLNNMYDEIFSKKGRAFKAAQFIHSLNVISIWKYSLCE